MQLSLFSAQTKETLMWESQHLQPQGPPACNLGQVWGPHHKPQFPVCTVIATRFWVPLSQSAECLPQPPPPREMITSQVIYFTSLKW